MISRELEAKILRLYHAEKWPIGTIASQLQIHHDVIERVLTALCAKIVNSIRRGQTSP